MKKGKKVADESLTTSRKCVSAFIILTITVSATFINGDIVSAMSIHF